MYVKVRWKVINSYVLFLWIIVHGSMTLGVGVGQLSSSLSLGQFGLKPVKSLVVLVKSQRGKRPQYHAKYLTQQRVSNAKQFFSESLNFWKIIINAMNAVLFYQPEEPGRKGSIRGNWYTCIWLKEGLDTLE